MVEFLIVIALFYFLALGVCTITYTLWGIGYERAPVFWILYICGVLIFFAQTFPNEVWTLFPPHTFIFTIVANFVLLFAAFAARLELVGRHPTHELFLNNRIEFARFKSEYLVVKSIEVLVQ